QGLQISPPDQAILLKSCGLPTICAFTPVTRQPTERAASAAKIGLLRFMGNSFQMFLFLAIWPEHDVHCQFVFRKYISQWLCQLQGGNHPGSNAVIAQCGGVREL